MNEWQGPSPSEADRGTRRFPLDGPVLALDLGGTQIRTAAVRPDGTLLVRAARATPAAEGAAAIVDACIATLREACDGLDAVHRAGLVGVGISATGPVDPGRGVIVDPPNISPDFRDVPLAAAVERGLGLPAVLERDTHVAALAEQAFGAGRGVDDFVYLTISTGIGGAIVSGGELLPGRDDAAAEFGHVTLQLDGPACGCGERGHFEALASGLAIATAGRDAVAAGRSAPLAEAARRAAPGALSARGVAEAADAGDAVATAIMAAARDAFVASILGIVNMLNPSRIVVGGSVAHGQGDRWLQPARDAARLRAFSRDAGRRVQIVLSELGDDVGLVGAVPLLARRLRGVAPAVGARDRLATAKA
jgi:glucokinase